jgi:hypothetical protein
LPSFYSERTAEYALVPKFVELLEPLGAVAPIAFAGQRENTNVACWTQDGERFRVAAFFARRPKIESVGSNQVHGKINERLFWVSSKAWELGVPTFCGISLTNNVFDQLSTQPLWFDISEHSGGADQEFSCLISESGQLDTFNGAIQPVDPEAIRSRVQGGKTMSWTEATWIMSELPGLADRTPPRGFLFLSQIWRLRPIYFAIRCG